MYEELIMRLMEDKSWIEQGTTETEHEIADHLQKAADAIEELEKAVPRWIPVTERLPEAQSGNVSERVLVTDGEDVAIVEWFNFEECGPFWGYTGFGKDVTHWMPLPSTEGIWEES